MLRNWESDWEEDWTCKLCAGENLRLNKIFCKMENIIVIDIQTWEEWT